MNILKLRTELSNYKTKKQAFLNDTYLWVNMAIEAIENLPQENLVFEVPSTKNSVKRKAIRRNNREEVINRIINKDIYNSAYVMMISAVEDYFNKIMKLLLTYDNNRIKFTMQGLNMQSNINIMDFLNNNKEEMIQQIINQRIDNIFYASPKKQLEYLDGALGINLSEKSWYTWIEYKARRDIIVHNNGVVNDIYMEKVSGYGKFVLGEQISFSKEEFSNIISKLKSIIGEVDKIIRDEYHIPTSREIKESTEQK